jgi:hypothetical protein
MNRIEGFLMIGWLRRAVLLLSVMVLLLSAALLVRPAMGEPVEPVYREADSCADLSPPGVTWEEYRIAAPATGSYSTGLLTVELTLYQVAQGTVFDWQANVSIDAVYVAGGPGGNLYHYNPPGATEGTGLHAPLNPSGRNYHGLSEILFCSTNPLIPTPTPPVPDTATPTATLTPPATVTGTPPVTPTATVTVTGTPLATATEGPTPTVTATPTATPTMTATLPAPTGFPVFVPLSVFMNGPGREEPNNSCSEAFAVATNFTHEFLADDRHDWYTFVLPADASLSISVTNFTPLIGQLAAYRGESCTSSILLQNYGLPGMTKSLTLGQQPAGRYFLYVSNDGAYNDEEPYELTITAVE